MQKTILKLHTKNKILQKEKMMHWQFFTTPSAIFNGPPLGVTFASDFSKKLNFTHKLVVLKKTLNQLRSTRKLTPN